MAYFTKDEYFQKELWASNQFNEQAKIGRANGMSEELLDKVADVRTTRHWLHCNGAEALSNTEDSGNDKAIAIVTDAEGKYAGVFTSVCDLDIINEYDWDVTITDEEKQKYIDENDGDAQQAYIAWKCHAYSVDAAIVERINCEMEEWLKSIDEQYGTQFCPTGATRVLY